MTISQASITSILWLEETIRTRFVRRVLILCPDTIQCDAIADILLSLDYTIEKITLENIYDERSDYYSSIERLRTGLSKVLVTTPETLSMIQKNMDTYLHFDVIL